MKQSTPLKAKKPMNKVGKVGKATMQATKEWLNELEPPYNCIYCLYIGIDVPLLLEDMVINVEHTFSKARHPELRLVKGKYAISCPYHNQLKGSLNIDNFLKILDKQKEMEDGR